MGGWGRSGVFGAQPQCCTVWGLPPVDPSHPQKIFQRAANGENSSSAVENSAIRSQAACPRFSSPSQNPRQRTTARNERRWATLSVGDA